MVPWNTVSKHQFEYVFDDVDVIQDACHLILTQLQYAYIGNEVDKSRLETFIKTFIPIFFDLDRDAFDMKMGDIYDATPPNEEVEEEASVDADSNLPRNRRAPNGKKSNLLRGVLDRTKQGQKDDSLMQSKETTPDVQSNDEDTPASTGTPTEQPRVDPSEHRWMTHPSSGKNTADLNVPFKRDEFHLYASLNIYCFFRMFEMLYERLSNIKAIEQQVHKDIARAKICKPAQELRLIDKTPADFFADVSPSASYYAQIVQMCEDVVKQELEPAHLEETLRRFYMKNGWQLYSFDKMLASILRFALQILVSDNKDKSLDIINLFYKDRKEDETTHQAELTYRKQVEKLTKEGDIYRIRYVSGLPIPENECQANGQYPVTLHQNRIPSDLQEGRQDLRSGRTRHPSPLVLLHLHLLHVRPHRRRSDSQNAYALPPSQYAVQARKRRGLRQHVHPGRK